MKSDRSMGLMSQIETNLDDSFAAKTNTGWMSDFFLRYNQRNFPLLLRNRSRGPASCPFVPAGQGFRESWEFCRETMYPVQPFERGREKNDSQFARSMNSDAKKEGMQH